VRSFGIDSFGRTLYVRRGARRLGGVGAVAGGGARSCELPRSTGVVALLDANDAGTEDSSESTSESADREDDVSDACASSFRCDSGSIAGASAVGVSSLVAGVLTHSPRLSKQEHCKPSVQ